MYLLMGWILPYLLSLGGCWCLPLVDDTKTLLLDSFWDLITAELTDDDDELIKYFGLSSSSSFDELVAVE